MKKSHLMFIKLDIIFYIHTHNFNVYIFFKERKCKYLLTETNI